MTPYKDLFFRLHDVPFPDILLAVIFVFNFLKLTITEINNNFLGFDKSIFLGHLYTFFKHHTIYPLLGNNNFGVGTIGK